MTNKYFSLLMLFISGVVSAQVINFPDQNLRNALINYVPVIDTNNDDQIQVSEALAVNTLFLNSENITDLTGIQQFTNLTHLVVVGNNLTSVSLDGLVNLTGFNADYNQLTSFSMGSADNLQTLSLNENNLTTLDLSGKTIDWVSVTDNGLTQLILENAEIRELRCQNNSLTSLDLTDMQSLQKLFCFMNNIAELDFTQNPLLHRVEVQGNPLIGLDFSKNKILFEVSLNNPTLQFLSFKNGSPSTPNLSFGFSQPEGTLMVCTDDSDIEYFQNYFEMFNIENVYVSSYCTFVPGGDYNTITGAVTHDVGNDGCGASEPAMPNLRLNVTDGVNSGAVFTTMQGDYDVYADSGTYTVSPSFTNDYFIVSPPSAQVNFTGLENTIVPQNFCLMRNGIHKDLEITIVPEIPARPGFEATYRINYLNKGTEVMSGTVEFTYMDEFMDLESAVPAANAQQEGFLSWNYENLAPFESRSILVTMLINSPMDTPPVNIGMQLDFEAYVFPVAEDETPDDNDFMIKQIVVGSFDPNDITVLEGETVSPDMAGEYLHYLIRFQNTGTFYAENVLVTDYINPEMYDLSSFSLIGTSHPGVTRINGNKLEFIFEGINLPAEQDDEEGSNGYVAFKIRTLDTLVEGNTVSQFADIFFDFNLPITTNVATTTFATLGTPSMPLASASVYPNPTRGQLHIRANESIRKASLYDLRGRMLQSVNNDSHDVSVDLSNQQSGIYMLRIEGAGGVKTFKVVKE